MVIDYELSEDNYCTYEHAVKLKEKGFNTACNHYYRIIGLNRWEFCATPDNEYYTPDRFGDGEYMGPTLNQISEWLRNIHNIVISIMPRFQFNGENEFKIFYYGVIYMPEGHVTTLEYDSYEYVFKMAITMALNRIN